MRSDFYVYTLTDPRNNEVFYVGKGCGRRIDQHEVSARSGSLSNPFKTERIRQIILAGVAVVKSKVATGLSEQDAYRLERETICAYGIGNLTNITAGTDTASERARVLLSRVKPFEQWVSERPTGLDGQLAHHGWYHLIVAGLKKEAGIVE